MIFFYRILIRLFSFLLPVAALFNSKARRFYSGRRNLFSKLKEAVSGTDSVIWFHCASLGEFEQARPLIEKLRSERNSHLSPPTSQLLITFFSPSGYELRKDYKGADFVFYLPIDTKSNAKKFIEIVKPKQVFFVKYEFWYNYLNILNKKNIPAYLVSANFRTDQFAGIYGSYLKRVLKLFKIIFVQNEASQKLLAANTIVNTVLSGDLRFDKVAQTVGAAKKIILLEYFKNKIKLLVGGSTWEEDEKMLMQLDGIGTGFKLVVAPHEIHEKHIEQLLQKFPEALLYSKMIKEPVSSAIILLQEAKVLIIDTMGLLAAVYQYADVAYIGGGLGAGIHNILEATAFGVPTIFGTNHHKFPEAQELIDAGAAFSVTDANNLQQVISPLLSNHDRLKNIFALNKSFVQSRGGATEKILKAISE